MLAGCKVLMDLAETQASDGGVANQAMRQGTLIEEGALELVSEICKATAETRPEIDQAADACRTAMSHATKEDKQALWML